MLKKKLASPELELKGPLRNVLKERLKSIEANLSSALKQAGIDFSAPKKVARGNPVMNFLNLLTHGQDRLQKLSGLIAGLAEEGKMISPAKLLSIQLKVTYVGQELEFFTNVLNKSLESTKTIMNIQV